MTKAADRIEWFATQATALGCKVTDEVKPNGERTVHVSGAHWMDLDSVFVSFTPGASKGRKGARDSLFCMIFSNRKYPRKGNAWVEFHEAVSHLGMLKDYSAHTHCEPGRHVCQEATCTAIRDGKTCGIPESMHRREFRDLLDHTFTSGASE